MKKFINLPTNNEQLIDLYRATLLGFEYGKYDAGQLDSICNRVTEHLEKDGSARVFKRKSDSASYANTPYALNVLLRCIENLKSN